MKVRAKRRDRVSKVDGPRFEPNEIQATEEESLQRKELAKDANGNKKGVLRSERPLSNKTPNLSV